MKKSMLNLICFTTLALTATSISLASNRPGAITLSLSDGYYNFDSKRKLDNTYIQSLTMDYNLNQRFGIEGGVGLINTDTTRYNLNPKVGVHGYLFTVDGLYHFQSQHCFAPYALAGIGALSLKPNGTDSNYQGNINVGLGSQFFIDKSIAFKLEARDVYTMVGGKNDYLINFGISFLFDTCCSKQTC